MSTSRATSQAPSPYARKRSNTVQSSLRSPISATPLTVGNAKDLTLWVHEQANDVVFNPDCWPGVAEDDMIRVTELDDEENDDVVHMDGRPWERHGFLFIVKRHGEEAARHAAALQISVPKSIADAFGLQNHSRVRLTKVDSSKMRADYTEIVFQDQYLGRSDMWRLGKQLQGQCVHVGQEINFVGSPTGKIHNIYIDGRTVSAGLVTTLTKSIYRSLSAKVTIFIQVCRELWDFAGDGERNNEKVVHSFLPALFRRWRDAGTNHIVTIVLISRVYYEDSEIEYAAGPLRQDDDDRWYKDFFKVITDLEVVTDWKPTLVSLKESFVAFQRDILLTHHYHRAKLAGTNTSEGAVNPGEVKLVGRISYAHEGPILEALNLALNPMETHYVDRSLSLTGAATILITPGTGYYRVSKRLLRMTTTRLLDQGFGLDIVSLAKPPLHQTPIFSFRGYEPENRDSFRSGWRSNDPLWGGDDEGGSVKDKGQDVTGKPPKEKSTFWWEPFWIAMSFWDQQMDLPFRQDRFVARAKIHQIEMLGLLEHDVLSSINVPYLPEGADPTRPPPDEHPSDYRDACRMEAERFDIERFKLRKNQPLHLGRESAPSSGATIIMDPSSLRSAPFDKRPSYIMQRTSTITPRIAPIEESPRRFYTELPPEGAERDAIASADRNGKESDDKLVAGMLTPKPSTSPASSIASMKTEGSTSTSGKADDLHERKERPSRPTMGLGSKLASSWIFNPFRSSFSSQSVTSAPGSTEAAPLAPDVTSASSLRLAEAGSSRLTPATGPATISHTRTPRPMNIRSTPTRRSVLGQQVDEEAASSSRGTTLIRHSPRNNMGSSPRDDPMYLHRRSTITSLNIPMSASSPTVRVNPLKANVDIPHTQSSLASRWQHMFPQPLFRHQIKWKSMVTPGCLPLTTEYFPTKSELESSYDVFSYEFIIDPPEMKSFLVRNPTSGRESVDEARRLWALEVMRGMASLRLVQGFQFIIRPKKAKDDYEKKDRSSRYFSLDDDRTPKPGGASEIFYSTSIDPVFLSMSNEIHRISYNGEAIQVRRYVRRMPPTQPFHYKCLVWPKLGVGYTELSTTFGQNGLENYVWNRLDMLIAGYEHQFSESLRYWRTRFIIIPTTDAPPPTTGASGEKLNDEEIRLLGSDKLAELLSKLRWTSPGEREKGVVYPPVRFLPTYLSPTASVMDEHLVSQLEEIMAAAGPQGKNMRSDRELADMAMNLPALAKLMREDKGLSIKDHKWHTRVYQDSFTGYDFTTWLWREFRDVSTREQAQEWGMKLMEKGLFEHCRGKHGFLDGHYFYRLTHEYTVPRTPRSSRGWTANFRSAARYTSQDEKESSHRPSGFYPGGTRSALAMKKNTKRLVLSQTMVIDVDPSKKSDQAEMVVLHTDLIHNPANVFHFELHWLGTTARCIEDQLRSWGARIERYGLRLVEAYVTQIADIRERNPFQSCFPMRLALPPPFVPDLGNRLTQATGATAQQAQAQAQYFFEYALLRRFGFILDIEANELYPDPVDVFYSYRRSAFTHSQFVHRTGVAFVQVLGGAEGFLFLTNRLMGHGKTSPNAKSRGISPAAQADVLRDNMNEFCQDTKRLSIFYDEVLAALPAVTTEDPPPLAI